MGTHRVQKLRNLEIIPMARLEALSRIIGPRARTSSPCRCGDRGPDLVPGPRLGAPGGNIFNLGLHGPQEPQKTTSSPQLLLATTRVCL